MADDSVKTISARFEAREPADLAVEHLVQQHGIPRADIFIQAAAHDNAAGTKPSGGDISHGDGIRSDASLHGEIEVSADVREDEVDKVKETFRQATARDR